MRIKKLKPKTRQEYKVEGNLSGHLIQTPNLSGKGMKAQKSVTVQKTIITNQPFRFYCNVSCQFKTGQTIIAFPVIQFKESFDIYVWH